MRSTRFSLLIMALALSLGAIAQYHDDLGPKAGEPVPHAIAAPDQTGKVRRFADLTGEKGAVLVFFRSANWCPYCQAQLTDLNARRGDIEAAGYRLVGISYDPVDHLAAFAEKEQIGFPLLSDDGSEIIKGFGILNTEVNEKSRTYGIPYPMLVVVSADGTIRAKLAEESYRDRPEIDVLLAALADLEA